MSGKTYEGYIVGSSLKAVLFHGHYWEAPTWMPFSQCTFEPDGESWVVTVSPWLSGRNKIEEFTFMDEAAMEIVNDYEGKT